MRKLYHNLIGAAIAAGLILTGGCGHAGHDHDHDHEGHENHEHSADEDHDHGSHSEEDKEGESHNHGDELIDFSPEKQKASGIKTERVSPGVFYGVLKVGGRVTAASGEEMAVVATGSGIVRFSHELTDGIAVTKGASLLSISSASIADEGQLGMATVSLRGAQTELERAKKLAAERLISERELQEAQQNYELAKQAASSIGRIKSGGGVTVTSPLGGYVKELTVKPGSFVNAGDQLMVISSNKNLYLIAELPERYYSQLKDVTWANFKTSYSDVVYSIRELGGRKLVSNASSASGNRTVPVTFEFPNKGGIVANTFAEVMLLTGGRENVLSVPKSALIEEQGVFYVFEKHGSDHFEKKEVLIGATDGLRVEIKRGLTAGAEIVTDGAMKIKLASASNVIPAHNHNH